MYGGVGPWTTSHNEPATVQSRALCVHTSSMAETRGDATNPSAARNNERFRNKGPFCLKRWLLSYNERACFPSQHTCFCGRNTMIEHLFIAIQMCFAKNYYNNKLSRVMFKRLVNETSHVQVGLHGTSRVDVKAHVKSAYASVCEVSLTRHLNSAHASLLL